MEKSYLGEIRRFASPKLPESWLPCDGRLMPIDEHRALFSVLGNEYGGEIGKNTFALPDLRGRTPAHRNGWVAPLGATGHGPGPSRPYQTITYAINIRGEFPTWE